MVLPDVLGPGLRVVFCGTAVGSASAKRGAYYAGPGNKFWPTLHAIGLTPRRLMPEEFRSVLDYGIGLTDLELHYADVHPDAYGPAKVIALACAGGAAIALAAAIVALTLCAARRGTPALNH
jgi:hypothetical protein